MKTFKEIIALGCLTCMLPVQALVVASSSGPDIQSVTNPTGTEKPGFQAVTRAGTSSVNSWEMSFNNTVTQSGYNVFGTSYNPTASINWVNNADTPFTLTYDSISKTVTYNIGGTYNFGTHAFTGGTTLFRTPITDPISGLYFGSKSTNTTRGSITFKSIDVKDYSGVSVGTYASPIQPVTNNVGNWFKMTDPVFNGSFVVQGIVNYHWTGTMPTGNSNVAYITGVAPVPEPATMVALSAGLGLLARRRRKTSSLV